ncbi:hypothetical protein ACFU5N_02325 [Streptomyces albidoflavus]
MADEPQEPTRPDGEEAAADERASVFALCLPIGMSAGIMLGMAADRLALGMALGMVFGLVLAAVVEAKRRGRE